MRAWKSIGTGRNLLHNLSKSLKKIDLKPNYYCTIKEASGQNMTAAQRMNRILSVGCNPFNPLIRQQLHPGQSAGHLLRNRVAQTVKLSSDFSQTIEAG
jgi:hypothetical protein